MGVSTHHKADPCDTHTWPNLHVNNGMLKRKFWPKSRFLNILLKIASDFFHEPI